MFTKSVFQAMLLSLALLLAVSGSCYAAQDPTMQQVYDMAKAGKLDEAQTLMQKVLQDHPDSAKAHYVEAELLAKQGRFASAEAELNNADKLAPGLPFAKADSVEKLRRELSSARQRPTRQAPTAYANGNNYAASAPASSGPPWGLLILGAALIAFIIFAVKFMANRNQAPVYMQGGAPGSTGYGGGMTGPGYGSGMGGGPMMGGGGGMGSGIVGGLVTGAALGAGLVAGEQLMHHFTDSNGNTVSQPRDDYSPPQNSDMGGNDFGINDSSSWDSGGGDSGGDSGGGDW